MSALWCVATCILLFQTPAQSQSINDQTYWRLTALNDGWGGGITEIRDNYRSFGLSLEASFPVLNRKVGLRTRYSGFTRQSVLDSSRLDELEIIVGIPVAQLSSNFRLDVLAGGYWIGNLGGQSFQNFVHNKVGVSEIDMPYSSPDKVLPIIGAQLKGEGVLLTTPHGDSFGWTSLAAYHHSAGYLQSWDLNGGLFLKGEYADQIRLLAGYNHQNVFSDLTRQSAALAERGWYMTYSVQLGLAYYSMTVYPGNQFALGSMGINLQTGVRRKNLEQVDVILEMGSTTGENGFYQRYLWAGPFGSSSPFKLDYHYQFWSLTREKLKEFPQQRGHFQQFSLGVQYAPIRAKEGFRLLPYADLRLGYRDERIYPHSSDGERTGMGIVNGIAEAGLRIKLPGYFLEKNCHYGMNIHYSYMHPLLRMAYSPAASLYDLGTPHAALGVGGFVMIDL